MTPPQHEPAAVTRLPYEKPAVKSISLVADQVLGTNCKGSSDGISHGQNPIGCLANGCQNTLGS